MGMAGPVHRRRGRTDSPSPIRRGRVRESEIVIQRLLRAPARAPRELISSRHGIEAPADWDHLQSPETYIGYLRAEFRVARRPIAGPPRYTLPEALRLNRWGLAGDWTVGRQAAVLTRRVAGSRIASTRVTFTW